jgi:hypothetical protein
VPPSSDILEPVPAKPVADDHKAGLLELVQRLLQGVRELARHAMEAVLQEPDLLSKVSR